MPSKLSLLEIHQKAHRTHQQLSRDEFAIEGLYDIHPSIALRCIDDPSGNGNPIPKGEIVHADMLNENIGKVHLAEKGFWYPPEYFEIV